MIDLRNIKKIDLLSFQFFEGNHPSLTSFDPNQNCLIFGGDPPPSAALAYCRILNAFLNPVFVSVSINQSQCHCTNKKRNANKREFYPKGFSIGFQKSSIGFRRIFLRFPKDIPSVSKRSCGCFWENFTVTFIRLHWDFHTRDFQEGFL